MIYSEQDLVNTQPGIQHPRKMVGHVVKRVYSLLVGVSRRMGFPTEEMHAVQVVYAVAPGSRVIGKGWYLMC